MEKRITLERAQEVLLPFCSPVASEDVPLEFALGRVCALDQIARENFPAFDRSPFDGFAFAAADTLGASRERPITLLVVEVIPAGSVPTKKLERGQAVKLMTGAPIPVGASAVTKFEVTEFTDDSVTIFEQFGERQNVIPAGEDVKLGSVIAAKGTRISTPLIGALAAQGISEVEVYRKPRVGVVSTGSEVTPIDSPAIPGKLRDSNRYTFSSALTELGCEPVVLGLVEDEPSAIAALLKRGAELELDAILSTGGASVGDFDFINDAFELAGATTIAATGTFRPGGAFAFAALGRTVLLGLSGNPASAVTTLYAVCVPALRKLAGLSDYAHRVIRVKLAEPQRSRGVVRLVRGTLDLAIGTLHQHAQGNGMITSWNGCDAIAIVPADLPEDGVTVDAILL